MTSADDFVLQLIEDNSIVDSATIEAAKQKVAEDNVGGDPNTAALEALLADHALTQFQIAEALAEAFGMEVIDLSGVKVPEESFTVVNYDLANRYKVFPLEADDSMIDLAIADPLDMDAIDTLSHVLKRTVNTRVAPLEQIEEAIQENYEAAKAAAMGVDDIF